MLARAHESPTFCPTDDRPATQPLLQYWLKPGVGVNAP
jgi:hypothetical protein